MKSLGLFYEKVQERKILRRKKNESKFESSSRLLGHNASGLIRSKPKKVHLKTQENVNDL